MSKKMNKALRFVFNALTALGGATATLGSATLLMLSNTPCSGWVCLQPEFSTGQTAVMYGIAAMGTLLFLMGSTGYLGRDTSKPNMIQRGVAGLNNFVNGPRT